MPVSKTPIPADKINILFFGSYTNARREDYIEEMMKVLSSEEETYRRLTADLYDHGKVLRDDEEHFMDPSRRVVIVTDERDLTR